jgi:Flp pilus assembly protein TadD
MDKFDSNKFNSCIRQATEELQQEKFEKAYKTILSAINLNLDAPEPHNLIGIWYELKNKTDLARKHYRAAYALDPTYKPASENLERLCSSFLLRKTQVNFGEEIFEKQEI